MARRQLKSARGGKSGGLKREMSSSLEPQSRRGPIFFCTGGIYIFFYAGFHAFPPVTALSRRAGGRAGGLYWEPITSKEIQGVASCNWLLTMLT